MNSPLLSSRPAKSLMNRMCASTSSGFHWSIGTLLTGAGALGQSGVVRVLGAGAHPPGRPEQVAAGEEAEKGGEDEQYRAGLLVGAEPVHGADGGEEDGHAHEEAGLDDPRPPVAGERLVLGDRAFGGDAGHQTVTPVGPSMPGAAGSPWFMSHTGRSDRMSGSRSKLWWAGGESAAHSRVCPSQGLAPTRTGRRHER